MPFQCISRLCTRPRPAVGAAVMDRLEVPANTVGERKAVVVVEASYSAKEWEIRTFSHLEDISLNRYYLPTFVVEGATWCFFVQLTDCKSPGIFLECQTTELLPLEVKFAVTIVNKRNPNKNIFRGGDDTAEGLNIFSNTNPAKGWDKLFSTDPKPSGLIVDDTLMLHTRVRVVKNPPRPVQINRPLLTESQDFLRNLLKGKNNSDPDVMLKLGDDMLPGHRVVLSASSDYFRAMFKSGMAESKSDTVEIQDIAVDDMKVILSFIYGVLEATPDSDERLHSLLLAIDRLRLQVDGLMEHCVARLKSRLSLENFTKTLVLANRVGHDGLRSACVEFANRKENSSTFRSNEALKCAMSDPDLAFNLICDTLERQWKG